MSFIKHSDEEVIEALEACRGVISDTARALGLKSINSLRYRIKNNEVLNEACEEAREQMRDLSENRLFQAVEAGEKWAIVFYLRNLGKERGYTDEKNINVNAVQKIEFVWEDSDEEKYDNKHRDSDESQEGSTQEPTGDIQ